MRFTARRNWRTGYTAEALLIAIPIAVQGAAVATDAGIEATLDQKATPTVGNMLADGMLADDMLAVGVDVEDSEISIGEHKHIF